jgi:NAD-dependent deacetylase
MNTKRFKPIVILTGAGISAESGIRTFRDQNGLWEEHRIEDVASPEGFKRDRGLVNRFYNARRNQLKDPNLKPNAAHFALAELEKEWEGPFLLVTQNVDDLHERAGSRKLVHMHGELKKIRCEWCDEPEHFEDEIDDHTLCKICGRLGMRPHIVWFGEMPFFMDEITDALDAAEIFISIGTSGNVYPAAGFVDRAWRAETIEVNLQGSEISSNFKNHYVGPASEAVPRLVKDLLG